LLSPLFRAGRLVTARDPAAGSALPYSRSIENVVTFLLAGHETTRKRSPGRSILSRSFRIGRKRAREEIRRVAGDRLIGREPIQQLPLVEAIFSEAMPHLYALWRGSTKLHRQHLRHARR
jgi:cytochrome P450